MDKPQPTQLSFHYIKSNHFRVVHADGFIGGLTPRGLLHMAIYSERGAIPQLVVHDVTSDGRLGAEVQRVGREGVARELEVDVLLEADTVRALHQWLGDRLKELDDVKAGKKQGAH